MAPLRRILSVSLLVSLLASMVLAVTGLYWTRHLETADWFRANNEVAGNYLQTIGTIYAVLLAFVVFVVWQQHNDVREAVESEANELSDLHRILSTLPEPCRQPIGACIRDYQRAVVEEEWGSMRTGRASPQADRAVEGIWRAMQSFEPRSPREEALYSEALARFNDLSDARTHRLHCGRLRLPPAMWVLILTNGGLVVASMWLFGLPSLGTHILMTAALAGSIAFILYLIADLDNPFSGAWQVSADPMRDALRRGSAPPDSEGGLGTRSSPP